MILQTQPGERVMRPTFGSRVLDYVFESNGDVLFALVRREIARTLQIHEARVELLSVVPVSNDTTLTVDISYRVLGVEDKMVMSFS